MRTANLVHKMILRNTVKFRVRTAPIIIKIEKEAMDVDENQPRSPSGKQSEGNLFESLIDQIQMHVWALTQFDFGGARHQEC